VKERTFWLLFVGGWMSGNLLARGMKRIAVVGAATAAAAGMTLGTVEYASRFSPSRAMAAVHNDPTAAPPQEDDYSSSPFAWLRQSCDRTAAFLCSYPAIDSASIRLSALTRFTRTFAVASLVAADYKFSLYNKPKYLDDGKVAAAAENPHDAKETEVIPNTLDAPEPPRRGSGRLMHTEDHSASAAAATTRVSTFEADRTVNPEYKKALDECHARAAERLLWLALQHGGLYVKAAQHISSMNHVIPAQFTDTLSLLQVCWPRSRDDRAGVCVFVFVFVICRFLRALITTYARTELLPPRLIKSSCCFDKSLESLRTKCSPSSRASPSPLPALHRWRSQLLLVVCACVK
jgi:hypothetical protein